MLNPKQMSSSINPRAFSIWLHDSHSTWSVKTSGPNDMVASPHVAHISKDPTLKLITFFWLIQTNAHCSPHYFSSSNILY